MEALEGLQELRELDFDSVPKGAEPVPEKTLEREAGQVKCHSFTG